MTIYLDALFLLNFYFDFLLLMAVSITLKRNALLKRIMLGSLVGSVTIFILILPLNNILLFLFKVILAIIMNIITFGLKDKKYLIQNLSYFYMTSTVLGGFLYFLNLSFESVHGLVFIKKDISVNYLFLLILSPFILFLYVKQRKDIRHYNQVVPVSIYFKNGNCLNINGFIDTGNKLVDPVTKKKVILVNKDKLKGVVHIRSPMYVPYNSLNHNGLIKCISIDYIVINNKCLSDYLVGVSIDSLLSNGIDCVLNAYCLEEIY